VQKGETGSSSSSSPSSLQTLASANARTAIHHSLCATVCNTLSVRIECTHINTATGLLLLLLVPYVQICGYFCIHPYNPDITAHHQLVCAEAMAAAAAGQGPDNNNANNTASCNGSAAAAAAAPKAVSGDAKDQEGKEEADGAAADVADDSRQVEFSDTVAGSTLKESEADDEVESSAASAAGAGRGAKPADKKAEAAAAAADKLAEQLAEAKVSS